MKNLLLQFKVSVGNRCDLVFCRFIILLGTGKQNFNQIDKLENSYEWSNATSIIKTI